MGLRSLQSAGAEKAQRGRERRVAASRHAETRRKITQDTLGANIGNRKSTTAAAPSTRPTPKSMAGCGSNERAFRPAIIADFQTGQPRYTCLVRIAPLGINSPLAGHRSGTCAFPRSASATSRQRRAELERTEAKLLIRRAECRTLGSGKKSSTLSSSQSTRTITSAPTAPIERTLHLRALPSISVMLN